MEDATVTGHQPESRQPRFPGGLLLAVQGRPWIIWAASRLVALAVGLITAAAHRGNVFWDTTYYAHWVFGAAHGQVPYDDFAWEYPPAALPVMGLSGPYAPGLGSATRLYHVVYGVSWVVVALVVDALVFRALVRRADGPTAPAVTLWLWGLPLLGALSWARFDLFPAAAALVALLLAGRRHPTGSGVAAGVGAALKLWPGLLAPIQRTRRAFATATAATATVVLAVAALTYRLTGSLGFTDVLAYQSRRGLQIESVAALPLLWAQHLGIAAPPTEVAFGAVQYAAALVGPVVLGSTVALVAGVLLVYLAHWRLARVDAGPRGVGLSAMTLMLVILLTDKVLSPQYLLWLIAVLAAVSLLDPATWRPFVPWVLAAAAATQAEFPLLYRDLTHRSWPGLLVLTGRDILLAGLLVAVVRLLLRELRGTAAGPEPTATGESPSDASTPAMESPR